MPRKGTAPKREIMSDLVYNNKSVTQLMNKVLLRGKKGVAESIVYEAFEIIGKKTGQEPVTLFKRSLENVRPLLEVKPRRVGGATYQVPVEVNKERGEELALRWIVNFARERKEKKMCERLAAELLDASNGAGASVKKKEDLYKMAEANRAFAHYRW